MRGWRPTAFVAISAGLHLGGLAALLAWPWAWPWVVGFMVADHVVAVAAGLHPRSRLIGDNVTRLPSARRVALTFDDGPDPEITPRVLDLLRPAGARATFFCIGRKAEAHPELVAAIVAGGHRVENHSYRHSSAFALLGPGALGRDLDRAQEVLERTSGRRPELFRAPAGIRSPWLDPLLARRGLRLVSWSRRGFDTVDGRADRVLRRLTRSLRGGSILLLHDGGSARDGTGNAVVLEVLPRLLRTIEDLGLEIAPLAPDETDQNSRPRKT